MAAEDEWDVCVVRVEEARIASLKAKLESAKEETPAAPSDAESEVVAVLWVKAAARDKEIAVLKTVLTAQITAKDWEIASLQAVLSSKPTHETPAGQ